MTALRKTLKWITLSFLFLFISLPILKNALNIEFTYPQHELAFHGFLFWGSKIIVLLTLTWTIRKSDEPIMIMGKVLATFCFVILLLFISVASAFSDFCTYHTEKTLYINKNDESQQIIVRSFGCGVFDNGEPTTHIHKLNYFTPYLFRASPVDTTNLKIDIWRRL